jgi:hypothetical protein
LLGTSAVTSFLTFDKRKLHEYLFPGLFAFLAIGSVRNIPLFALIAIPLVGRQLFEISGKIRLVRKKLSFIGYIIMLILPVALIPRLITNAYYMTNNSFMRTGVGINTSHQPAMAAGFMLGNHLDGRILNSIGFGGWLSWTLPQPVFIDGRLEVMQESLYREVTESWHGGLPAMINKYKPQLIIFNYLKYYPWTIQLKEMSGWRLIYLDGIAAIFAASDYAPEVRELDLSGFRLAPMKTDPGTFKQWFRGFYRQPDYVSADLQHQALFRLQMQAEPNGNNHHEKAVAHFNAANLKYSRGDLRGAIAGYDSAIILQPGYAKAYNNRGILRASALKDYSGAISDFDNAIHFNPGYGEAYLGRGTAYFLMQDMKNACRDWNRARLLGNIQAARLIELHCNR